MSLSSLSPRGLLQRQILKPGRAFPVMEYLRRVEALFAENEWEWSEDRSLAHRFTTYADAETAAALHTFHDDGRLKTPLALAIP